MIDWGGESPGRACQVCGWLALPGTDRCTVCLDLAAWARVNRAACDLLHRGIEPAHADPLPYTAIDL